MGIHVNCGVKYKHQRHTVPGAVVFRRGAGIVKGDVVPLFVSGTSDAPEARPRAHGADEGHIAVDSVIPPADSVSCPLLCHDEYLAQQASDEIGPLLLSKLL